MISPDRDHRGMLIAIMLEWLIAIVGIRSLPLIGATTVRDALGGGLDRLVRPLAVGAPFNQLAFTVPTGAVSALDHCIDFDDQLKRIRDQNANAYAARRGLYLRQREEEIQGLHDHGRARKPPRTPSSEVSPALDTPRQARRDGEG